MTGLVVSMALGLVAAVATYPTMLDWPTAHALSVVLTAGCLVGILALKFVQQLADLERQDQHDYNHGSVQCDTCHKWTPVRDVRYWHTGRPNCPPCAQAIMATIQTPQPIRAEQRGQWPSDKDAA